ncbi:MAG: hypothetical protein ACRCXX_11825 [Cetobacterium sp.]|uniref:hypothetical protein n=1 Tax=Cetobacterium sp. TaxID=2071632 RepID=UPI003F331937
MDKAIKTKDMAVTPHIKLKLPSQNDYYDVEVTNENSGIIDAEIKKLQDAGKTHENNKDNPHAVTKEQVGLGEVQNYPATSAVNDASNTKYATAGAVKVVQDNANGRVSKTGDTMTGILRNAGPDNQEGLMVFERGGTLSTVGSLVAGIKAEWISDNAKLGIARGSGYDIPLDGVRFHHNDNVYKVYHQGFKPTKSDVGLGSVGNYSAVNKSGDTMTGDLIVNGNVSSYNKFYSSFGFVIDNPENGTTEFRRSSSAGSNVRLNTIRSNWHSEWADVGFHRGDSTNLDRFTISFNKSDNEGTAIDAYQHQFFKDGTLYTGQVVSRNHTFWNLGGTMGSIDLKQYGSGKFILYGTAKTTDSAYGSRQTSFALVYGHGMSIDKTIVVNEGTNYMSNTSINLSNGVVSISHSYGTAVLADLVVVRIG